MYEDTCESVHTVNMGEIESVLFTQLVKPYFLWEHLATIFFNKSSSDCNFVESFFYNHRFWKSFIFTRFFLLNVSCSYFLTHPLSTHFMTLFFRYNVVVKGR